MQKNVAIATAAGIMQQFQQLQVGPSFVAGRLFVSSIRIGSFMLHRRDLNLDRATQDAGQRLPQHIG